MRDEVSNVVIQFFHNGKLLKAVNNATMSLIPKVSKPTFVKYFRPIAWCTTLYKLIAKILTRKLKMMVDYPVGASQSALIEGKNILDNIMLSHELVKR